MSSRLLAFILAVLSAATLPQGVAAAADGSSKSNSAVALALAALVGAHDEALSEAERQTLNAFLDGKTPPEAVKPFKVNANSVLCITGNIDITSHRCEIAFPGGKPKIGLSGRAAHELYATMIENGVDASPGAGSLYAVISALSCAVDPKQIAEKAGGGAECQFKDGN